VGEEIKSQVLAQLRQLSSNWVFFEGLNFIYGNEES